MLSITDFQHEIQTQNFLECHYDTATFWNTTLGEAVDLFVWDVWQPQTSCFYGKESFKKTLCKGIVLQELTGKKLQACYGPPTCTHNMPMDSIMNQWIKSSQTTISCVVMPCTRSSVGVHCHFRGIHHLNLQGWRPSQVRYQQ
jgi:hypothetical protein